MDEPSATSQPDMHDTDVLVVGGGPIGMLTAYQLARRGVSCILLEQGTRTTSHPKMEFLSTRSMEILRQIGLADELRAIGVPEEYDLDEAFTTGLGAGRDRLGTSDLDSPAVCREKAKKENDGSHSREPYMRLSQILLEAWLKPLCAREELIDDRWGWTFETLAEHEDHVVSTVRGADRASVCIKSKYVVGCDGAGSKARLAAGLEAKRKPLPMEAYVVHFRSHDLKTLMAQGHFWHLIFLTGAILVNQDEKEIFTLHTIVPPGKTVADFDRDPLNTLYEGIGGIEGPCKVEVDQILTTGSWRSSLSVADAFRSANGRVFLAGDAAHQLTPVGGLGFNSGVGDAYDLSWKLGAVQQGYGGEHLLASYDHERRAVAKANVKRVEQGAGTIIPLLMQAATIGSQVIYKKDEAGEAAQKILAELLDAFRLLHKQEGTYRDYRYRHSPIIDHDGTDEHEREVLRYMPSTWPGVRAPHVSLSDGETSILDLYGPDFSVVDFTTNGEVSIMFAEEAQRIGVPLKRIHLPKEDHVHLIWQRDVVLVRPDGHVAWRAPADAASVTATAVEPALAITTGHKVSPNYKVLPELQEEVFQDVAPEERIQRENEMLADAKTGRLEQLTPSSQ